MYEIILYDTEDGRCPVQELLDSLEPKLLAKTLRTIDPASRYKKGNSYPFAIGDIVSFNISVMH